MVADVYALAREIVTRIDHVGIESQGCATVGIESTTKASFANYLPVPRATGRFEPSTFENFVLERKSFTTMIMVMTSTQGQQVQESIDSTIDHIDD